MLTNYDDLPEDIHLEVSKNYDTSTAASAMSVSTKWYRLFSSSPHSEKLWETWTHRDFTKFPEHSAEPKKPGESFRSYYLRTFIKVKEAEKSTSALGRMGFPFVEGLEVLAAKTLRLHTLNSEILKYLIKEQPLNHPAMGALVSASIRKLELNQPSMFPGMAAFFAQQRLCSYWGTLPFAERVISPIKRSQKLLFSVFSTSRSSLADLIEAEREVRRENHRGTLLPDDESNTYLEAALLARYAGVVENANELFEFSPFNEIPIRDRKAVLKRALLITLEGNLIHDRYISYHACDALLSLLEEADKGSSLLN